MASTGQAISVIGKDLGKFSFRNNYPSNFQKSKNMWIMVMLLVSNVHAMTSVERESCELKFRRSFRGRHVSFMMDSYKAVAEPLSPHAPPLKAPGQEVMALTWLKRKVAIK
ncbi:hypothetical protein PV05_09277 [Exophiala xenobiotica]|uniref:Uncharacterized protein n=1 Tax=Exophiala xenobiotica TaxID=348802 RepID=A0A0D2BMH0_9EURO|nr:uncharacterized protein PV05_09277 [Exophiala xenobiotica]KIW53731.1 hypothetical protein PV05_09277 [Exophiala xenobiotica]